MRTAPAPNIPPIPGMNPGTFIAGGGGGGGGGSGDTGDGSGGSEDGNVESGGQDAQGGANSAKGCGPGQGGHCMNPVHGNNGGTTAGDPIDALTGRVFTRPSRDIVLPGPLPLVLIRAYSSSARDRDVGLGFGWSHSFASRIEVRRRRVRVCGDDATYQDFRDVGVGTQRYAGGRVLTRHATEFETFDRERRTRVYREAVTGSGVYELAEIHDSFGNRIALERDDRGLLTGFVDSAGRVGRVVRGSDGRIAAFDVADGNRQWMRFVEYAYDVRGDLIASRNPKGDTTSYAYDDDHRLVRETTPAGRSAHYVYDEQGRCRETWVSRIDGIDGVDRSLDFSCPKLLADNTTCAKGVLHCKLTFGMKGFVEVVTSREVRRFFGNAAGKVDKAVTTAGGVSNNAYDRWGNLTRYVDPLGSEWRWERDSVGRVTAAWDPLGAVSRYLYDENGQLAARIDPLGRVVRTFRGRHGEVLMESDALGPLIELRYDERGLVVECTLPDGGVTRMTYDAMGNRIGIVEPNGGARQIHYDYFGRIVGATDENGQPWRYEYDAANNLLAVREPSGAVTAMAYDTDGHMISLTTQAGRTWRLAWSGYEAVDEVERPDGTRVRFRYDREGDLVRVINERGDEHVITRDVGGRVVAEKTFDNRRTRFRLDLLGRIERMTFPSGKDVALKYDALGNVVERAWNEEITETFTYDLAQRLVAASDGASEYRCEYDERSNPTREMLKFEGREATVEKGFDPTGRRVSMKTSLGHEERVRFDTMSRAQDVWLGRGDPVRFLRDAMGNETERVLPGGARVRYTRDSVGEVLRRRVYAPGAGPAVGAEEPVWVGDHGGVLVDQTFTYDPDGMLTGEWMKGRGATEFAYDRIGRVLSRVPEKALKEVFAYDVADERMADGRRYDANGLLVDDGRASYVYDDDHRLIEKRAREDGGEAVWGYNWDARGMLARVDRPDGSRVHLRYDMFARLVSKRVERREGGLARECAFVWDGRDLVHELTRELDKPDDPVIEERTYAYEPGTLTLLAQHVLRKSAAGVDDRGWAHCLVGQGQRPELLLDDRGEVLARLEGQVWGRVETEPGAKASTKLRYARHWEDSDTSLHYNLYRHYDPDLGRYISPEPLGLEGGMRPFGYAEANPLRFIDSDGLAGMVATATDSQDPSIKETGTAVGTEPGGGAARLKTLHPAVQRCLLPAEASQEKTQFGKWRNPASCAEPQAVSNFLRAKGVRDDASDEEIAAALRTMQIGAAQENDGTKRAPCANCSQFFARLNKEFGAPTAAQIKPGSPTAAGGKETNFVKPKRQVPGVELADEMPP